MEPIIDFTINLASVPSWMLPYTTSPKGCLQMFFVTMKLKGSQSNYRGFTGDLLSMLSELQWKRLE